MFIKVLAGLALSTVLLSPVASAKTFQTPSYAVTCAITPDPALPPPNPDEPFDAVACQGGFTQPGATFTVTTTGDGTLSWTDAGPVLDGPSTRMVYQRNYHWSVWTIRTAPAGTKITNSRTGHGMYVSIDNVYAF
jgi:hypothetical protein